MQYVDDKLAGEYIPRWIKQAKAPGCDKTEDETSECSCVF